METVQALATFSIFVPVVRDGEGDYSTGESKNNDSGDLKGDPQSLTPPKLQWRGEIPTQKWAMFYSRVVSRFAADPELKLTLKVEFSVDGEVSEQKLHETKVALQELSLDDNVEIQ